jgi:hypothetical protein
MTDAAAAQQLLHVASALDTAAVAGRGSHLPQAWGGEVQLVPSLCLLLYQSHLHGGGQEDEEEGGGMNDVLSFMSARVRVSGACARRHARTAAVSSNCTGACTQLY